MSKILFVLSLILFAAPMAASQHDYHSWSKLSEQRGKDAYGNLIVICTWECRTQYDEKHQTQTQGPSSCRRPSGVN